MNNSFKKILIISLYILGFSLLLFSLGSLYAYLNTGAERSKMLHTGLLEATDYTPELTWVVTANEGRPIDTQTRLSLEKDYLSAWEVRNIALTTNNSAGISDYYNEKAQGHLTKVLKYNRSKKTSIETTSLAHRPEVLFFSEDGQIIVLKDHRVKEYVRVAGKQHNTIHNFEYNGYLVSLILEDGFWRIRHMIKTTPPAVKLDTVRPKITTAAIKGINYYPQDTPWDMFGDRFDPKTIKKDFEIIQKAGLNTIRIFIQYKDFGQAQVNADKLEKLNRVLDIATKHNLKVLITLFDFYGDYSVFHWTADQKHAKSIVQAVKNHKALLGWDIKNEPNLDFDTRGRQLVLDWLENMIAFVRSLDPVHPITIGWSDTVSAALLYEQVDFVSFHYYEDLKNLPEKYKTLKAAVNEVPIVLGEFGLSSYRGLWNMLGSSEKKQAEYHREIQSIINEMNLGYMSWTLYDFNEIPSEVVGTLPWRRQVQKKYGFIDKNGLKKPAFQYLTFPLNKQY